MKTVTGIVLGVLLIFGITQNILSDYHYDKQIESYWKLADKASTIKQKSIYIDKFVIALETSGTRRFKQCYYSYNTG